MQSSDPELEAEEDYAGMYCIKPMNLATISMQGPSIRSRRIYLVLAVAEDTF